MQHEKSIFLHNCLKELEENEQKINAISILNMILYKGGDLIITRKCRVDYKEDSNGQT